MPGAEATGESKENDKPSNEETRKNTEIKDGVTVNADDFRDDSEGVIHEICKNDDEGFLDDKENANEILTAGSQSLKVQEQAVTSNCEILSDDGGDQVCIDCETVEILREVAADDKSEFEYKDDFEDDDEDFSKFDATLEEKIEEHEVEYEDFHQCHMIETVVLEDDAAKSECTAIKHEFHDFDDCDVIETLLSEEGDCGNAVASERNFDIEYNFEENDERGHLPRIYLDVEDEMEDSEDEDEDSRGKDRIKNNKASAMSQRVRQNTLLNQSMGCIPFDESFDIRNKKKSKDMKKISFSERVKVGSFKRNRAEMQQMFGFVDEKYAYDDDVFDNAITQDYEGESVTGKTLGSRGEKTADGEFDQGKTLKG